MSTGQYQVRRKQNAGARLETVTRASAQNDSDEPMFKVHHRTDRDSIDSLAAKLPRLVVYVIISDEVASGATRTKFSDIDILPLRFACTAICSHLMKC